MTKVKKLLLFAIFIATSLIGSNAQAIEFKSNVDRRLSFYGMNLKSSFSTGPESSESVSLSEFARDLLQGSNYKEIYRQTIIQDINIFCDNSSIPLPIVADYELAGGGGSFKNDAKAYILSYPRSGISAGDSLANPLQVAYWKEFNGTDVTNTTGEKIYNEAQAFEQYRRYYKEPTVNTREAVNKDNVIGPFTLDYTIKYAGTTMFGQITSATLSDENGNNVSSWSFLDANKNALSNNVSGNAYSYPMPGQKFYIQCSSNIGKGNLSFSFNNVSATGTTVGIKGTYKKEAASGMYLCAEHRNQLNANRAAGGNCGDSYYDLNEKTTKKVPGYKITTSTASWHHNTQGTYISGDVPSGITTTGTVVRLCL